MAHLKNNFIVEKSFDPALRELGVVYERSQRSDCPTDVSVLIEKVFEIYNKRNAYCNDNTSPDTPNARMISEKTHAMAWSDLRKERKIASAYSAAFMSSKGQGKLLQFLIRMQKAKRALEIGMFTGYVAMAMAEVLPQDGVVVTCELDPYLVEEGRKEFDKTAFGKKIDIRQGPAMDSLGQLAAEEQQFDIIYVDADKGGYLGYYQKILDQGLLAKDGTLVVDNAFEFGLAITNPSSHLNKFNMAVTQDDRVDQVLLSVFDGVTLIRWKGE